MNCSVIEAYDAVRHVFYPVIEASDAVCYKLYPAIEARDQIDHVSYPVIKACDAVGTLRTVVDGVGAWMSGLEEGSHFLNVIAIRRLDALSRK